MSAEDACPNYHRRSRRAWVVLLGLAALGLSPRVGAETTAAALVEGEAVNVTLASGDTVSRDFIASAGDAFVVEVSQRDRDLIVSIQAPAGGTTSFDSPLQRDGFEFALIHGSTGTHHRITLQSTDSGGSPTTHTLRVYRATSGDVAAWRLMSDAAALNAGGEREQQLRALDAYREAAVRFERLDDPLTAAQALYSVAMLQYLAAWDWPASIDAAERVAQRFSELDEPTLYANAVLLQAMALTEAINETDDKEPLLERVNGLLDESFAVHEARGNVRQQAAVRYFNGLASQNAGRFEASRGYYRESAALFAKVNDWRQARNILLNVAVLDINTGKSSDAIAALEELLLVDERETVEPTAADSNFRATVLDQLGAAYAGTGDVNEALRAFSDARDLHDAVGDLHGKAESLRGIARIYLDSGNLALAKQFLRQAEEAATVSNNGRVLGIVQTSLGNIAYSEQDFESAREFHEKALAVAPDEGPIRAYRQVLLAKSFNALGQYHRGRELAAEARGIAELAKSPRTEADALQQIAHAWFGLDDAARSVENFRHAYAWYEFLGLVGSQADVENALALVLAALASAQAEQSARLNNLDEALDFSKRSLEHVDALLGRISAPELKAYYASARHGYFLTHIDLLMERFVADDSTDPDYVSEALSTSERARARLTMDLLNEASVDLQRNVDPEMAAEVDSVVSQLAALDDQRQSIVEAGGDRERIRDRLSTVASAEAEYRSRLDLLQVELRSTNPHYGVLTAPATVSVADIQELIDEESVLLQYSLGESRSFVWVVTRDALIAVELAGRAAINSAVESLLTSLRTPGFGAAARKRRTETARHVAELVLQPVAALIGERRLIVVADETLNYLPFQTLPLMTDGVWQPLLETREVVALPSMSVLAVLQERVRKAPPERSLAVFADPVFERSDPRLAQPDDDAATVAVNGDATFITRSSLAGYLPRLEGTLEEARAIAALAPDDDPLVVLGFSANRETVLSEDLARYRYLHFATHGKVDAEIPSMSALVFSRFDEQGRPRNGYLRLNDIFGLEINADLVVLSACETGLGTAIRGEGLIGLTQGFLYAGAKSLLVSLWEVPDGATSELMARFYTGIFEDGLRPPAALRRAQLSMASEARWSDPFFWGAFSLLGDWQ